MRPAVAGSWAARCVMHSGSTVRSRRRDCPRRRAGCTGRPAFAAGCSSADLTPTEKTLFLMTDKTARGCSKNLPNAQANLCEFDKSDHWLGLCEPNV